MGAYARQKKKAESIRKPWERERLVMELNLVGKYGLKNKKELRTITAMVKKDKAQAKKLLITTNNEDFMTQGRAILNRLIRLGIMHGVDFNDSESIRSSLKDILNFEPSNYLDRRLQTIVLNQKLAKNIHLARNYITQRHIVINGRVNDKPGMLILAETEGFIELNRNSAITVKEKGRFTKRNKKTQGDEE